MKTIFNCKLFSAARFIIYLKLMNIFYLWSLLTVGVWSPWKHPIAAPKAPLGAPKAPFGAFTPLKRVKYLSYSLTEVVFLKYLFQTFSLWITSTLMTWLKYNSLLYRAILFLFSQPTRTERHISEEKEGSLIFRGHRQVHNYWVVTC